MGRGELKGNEVVKKISESKGEYYIYHKIKIEEKNKSIKLKINNDNFDKSNLAINKHTLVKLNEQDINKETKVINKAKAISQEYILPQDTFNVFIENKEIIEDCKNFSLLFNKYIKHDEDFKHIIEDKFTRKIDYKNNNPFNYIRKKIDKIAEYYEKRNYTRLNIEPRKISSRMIIGLGEISTREISIKLDHIYGIPYIPASTLKGAFRDYLSWEENKKGFIDDIFGTEEKRGKLIFTDTYPEQGFDLQQDVMTPHYSKYYSGENNPPTDDQSPRPIKFITLENATFQFSLFISSDLENDREKIETKFNQFLNKSSIGAKSSVGYGYFKQEKEGGNSSEN